MNSALASLWAKTGRNNDNENWHPLVLHMLDVAATVDAILEREPEITRKRMGACLGMEWMDARPWILLLVSCHDLGKACPGFQYKWPEAPLTSLQMPRSPDTTINHAFVSQLVLSELLPEMNWPEELAFLAADAIGCHHGERSSPTTQNNLYRTAIIGGPDWTQARRELVDALMDVFSPVKTPVKQDLSGPDFMLIAGLTSFADWIGSNETYFPFGSVNDCENLPGWFQKRKKNATTALDAIGWGFRTPLSRETKPFKEMFQFDPRPLQQAIVEALPSLVEPAILLVEAPMGEGKTEAAFYAHLELQRRLGHRGLYIALPTKATGNAMFERALKFLQQHGPSRKLDFQLLHGATLLNTTFQHLKLSGVYDPTTGGEIRAGEWFTQKKRALLSEYGVGTVDQAILPILPVRHNFVRLWGLANRVVVFDEIHAYDAYTGTLLIHLLRWLLALGSSVILLSATLPPAIRRKLADVVGGQLPEQEEPYPRLTIFQHSTVKQKHFNADVSRRRDLRIVTISPDLADMRSALDKYLAPGGMGLALVNTVQRAQDLYRSFAAGEPLFHKGYRIGKQLADGTEVFLFHARFPAVHRQMREEHALSAFGEAGDRSGRKILIATQVAEQSLDLDFDVIATDLAPIDLLLQRAGRLWRHERLVRPVDEPVLIVGGLAGDEPPLFGKPLWWEAVYGDYILLLTWHLLRNRQTLTLPDEIDTLVQKVYEEQVNIPETIQNRFEKAMATGDGQALVERGQANHAIIGFPDDASWNDPTRFILHDEDEAGVHRTLMAKTRLGEDSVNAIPLWPDQEWLPETTPDFQQAQQWFLQSINISRKGIVNQLRATGVPDGWKQSPLLRNSIPLVLNAQGYWEKDSSVRLDDDLGLVYETKESI